MNNSNQLIILILSIAFIVYGIYQIKVVDTDDDCICFYFIKILQAF